MELISIVSTVIILLLTFIFVRAQSWYRFINSASKIPGPSLWYILRNMSGVIYNTVPFLHEMSQSYNFKPFRVTIWGNIVVFLTDPDDIAVVLKHRHLSDKPWFFYGTLESMIGENLVTLGGSVWKHHRRAFNPGFQQQVLWTYIPVFNAEAQDFVKSMRTEKNVDLSELLFSNVLLTLIKATIWTDFDSKSRVLGLVEKAGPFVGITNIAVVLRVLTQTIEETLAMLHVSSMNPFKRYYSLRYRKHVHRISKDIQTWKSFFQKLVSERKNDVENMLGKGNTDFSPSSSLEHSIVQKNAGKLTLSDKELTDEMLILVLAGVETSSLAVNVVITLLALHREVQDKVSEELYSIFERSERAATMDDLKKMEYLDCVMKEALRLFTPVPVIVREAKEDVDINGTVVPKGGLVGLFFSGLHRNPKCFENPHEFRPERFFPGKVEKIPQYGFVPFSAGPRGCIGSRFAMLQMKTLISTFLRSYEVRPGQGLSAVDDIKVAMRFTLRFDSEIPVRLYPRKWDK